MGSSALGTMRMKSIGCGFGADSSTVSHWLIKAPINNSNATLIIKAAAKSADRTLPEWAGIPVPPRIHELSGTELAATEMLTKPARRS